MEIQKEYCDKLIDQMYYRVHKDNSGIRERGYELIREVGRGTFGVVYKARHIKTLKKLAIKIIFSTTNL
jgi:serine/threonine protein kinase